MKSYILLVLFVVCGLSECLAQLTTFPEPRYYMEKRYETNGNVIHAQLPDMRAVWKKNFRYFISVPENGGLKVYITLKKQFSGKDSFYNRKNTLIICTNRNVEYVKEVLGKVTVYINDFDGFYSQKGVILAGSASVDLKKDNKDAFVFVLEKEL